MVARSGIKFRALQNKKSYLSFCIILILTIDFQNIFHNSGNRVIAIKFQIYTNTSPKTTIKAIMNGNLMESRGRVFRQLTLHVTGNCTSAWKVKNLKPSSLPFRHHRKFNLIFTLSARTMFVTYFLNWRAARESEAFIIFSARKII